MNWLAHIVLAGPDPDDQLGGVLADLVPMAISRGLPAGLRRGVALHLSIDAFSDAHPAVGESVRRISAAGVGLRPVAAAVAVDMLYDHLLAQGWARHGTPGVGLDAFARGFYTLAGASLDTVPPNARPVLTAMAAQDWLGSYRELDQIHSALERIRQRLSPRAAAQCPLAAAVDVFRAQPSAFEEDFSRFWPDVTAHAAQAHAAAKHDL